MPKKKSLAPFGDTLLGSKRRLEELKKSFQATDPETIMMRLWEEENVRNTLHFNMLPIEGVLCLDRGNLEISENDRQVMAATVQWFATSCGRAFFYEFQQRLDKADCAHLDKIPNRAMLA